VKTITAILLLSLCVVVAHAEDVTIFDYQTGQFSTYGVSPGGGVFDYQTGTYSYPNYSLQRTGPSSYSAFDYNRATFQDIRLRPGGATVFDYGTARFYEYGVSPSPVRPLYRPLQPLLPPLTPLTPW